MNDDTWMGGIQGEVLQQGVHGGVAEGCRREGGKVKSGTERSVQYM